ncbi:hypothetical protein H5410_031292 [Solanum commersonii]|uniref:Uncharacterized protein n=1 Tax=Solanum commersonii TaxID=4109 RepID=A0A9J5YHY5_SOLCO|nr:hypothetical protein H5410_031292 [Solanum commersonii]
MELLVENLVFFDEINAAIETIDYTPNYLLYYMDIRNNRLFEGDKNLFKKEVVAALWGAMVYHTSETRARFLLWTCFKAEKRFKVRFISLLA